MKILLIDDEVIALAVMLRYLRKHGHEVTECDDPIKALGLIETYKYDCIITDYWMPEMNGIELAINVRNNPNEVIKHTPIMLLTGWHETTIVNEAKIAGINLVKAKEPNPEKNILLIEAAIEQTLLHNKLYIVEKKLLTAYKRSN
jgi:CheY-like chemotaxis protein